MQVNTTPKATAEDVTLFPKSLNLEIEILVLMACPMR